ncbi:unnamed protein product [Echinostoma caproni]|uniref:Uncharacterized protein n=1 Tax=Echinostoma caproni TaxID=27848 RepID=A0A3P8L860_9TREM|nr:unnamed protein product [Echinostoma caproni]
MIDQEAIASEIEKQICDVCHQVVTKSILYEKNAAFCSEECWQRVLHTALDDFTVGGMSAWPLDTFTSLKAKKFLVDLASKSYDGNMIVKMESFIQLTQQLGTSDLTNVEHLVHRLRIFAMTELVNDPTLARLHEACTQLADLLDFQFLYVSPSPHAPNLTIVLQHDAWRSFCMSDPNSDKLSSMLTLSLAETIRVCCDMDKTVGLGSRVHQLRTQHKVLDEQFRWLITEPLLHGGNWAELEGLLLEKKWLKRRVETTLPNDRLVMYLHSLHAPEDVLSGYLELSNDTDELLEIATRLRMYKVAVSCCAKRRDMAGMKELLSRIPKKEPEYAKVLYYLSLAVSDIRGYLTAFAYYSRSKLYFSPTCMLHGTQMSFYFTLSAK